MNELALFAGAGGGILGGLLAGWKTVCAVECDAYAAQILAQRQNDRALEPFPIWSDVRNFDGRPWKGIVDVVSGGFPCQDISVAGTGEGITGARSGLWKEMVRIIREVGPAHVFVENSPALTTRGLGVVLGDLAELGFNAEWGVLGASDVGAPHIRKRMWIYCSHPDRDIVRPEQISELRRCDPLQCGANGEASATADFDGLRESQREQTGYTSGRWSLNGSQEAAHITSEGSSFRKAKPDRPTETRPNPESSRSVWWLVEPNVVRLVHGVPYRLDQIKALGNAQVPRVAAEAILQFTKPKER